MPGQGPIDILAGRMSIDISGIAPRLVEAGRVIDGFVSRTSGRMNAMGSALSNVATKFKAIGDAAARSLQPIRAGVDNASRAITGLGVVAAATGVKMTALASDANEAASKFQFVFKDAADKTGKSLDEFANQAGRSRYEMRSMAADIGALIGPMGFTTQKTGELSAAVSKLAVDLSSFFNVSESDALMALRSAVVGESEPMRRLGVTLSEAKIQQEAMRLGLIKTKNEMNSQAKASAILSIVFKETAQAQGDAIRTGDQFANSWRRMRDFIKDTATDLGQAFIPAATKYARAIGDAAVKTAGWANANRDMLTQRVDEFLEKIQAGAAKVGNAFVSVYKSSGPVVDALKKIYSQATDAYSSFRKWFDALPDATKDLLKVGATLTALGVGLEKIGGSIPFIGQFAQSLGMLVNPLNMVRGGLSLLLPLIGAGGSLVGAFASTGVGIGSAMLGFIGITGPLGMLIAALGTFVLFLRGDVTNAIGGMAGAMKDALPDAMKAAKRASEGFVAYLNGDMLTAVGKIHQAMGNLASAVGMDGLAGELQRLGDSEILRSKSDREQHEKNVKRYGKTGAGILKRRSDAQTAAENERMTLRGYEAEGAVTRFVRGHDLDAQRTRVREANAKESAAAAEAMAFEKSPALQARYMAQDYTRGALKQAGPSLLSMFGSAADKTGDIAEQIKAGFKQAAAATVSAIEKGEAYNKASAQAGIEGFQNVVSGKKTNTSTMNQVNAVKSFARKFGVELDTKKVDELAEVEQAAREHYQKMLEPQKLTKKQSISQASAIAARDYRKRSGVSDRNAGNTDEARESAGVQLGNAKTGVKQARMYYAEQDRLMKKKLAGTADEEDLKTLASYQENTRIIQQDAYKKLPQRKERKPPAARQENAELAAGIREQKSAYRTNASSLRASGASQGDIMLIMGEYAKAMQLDEAAMKAKTEAERQSLRDESNMRKQGAQAMLDASKQGVKGIEGLTDAAKKAGVDMKKLDEAEQAKLLHAQGKQTPQEQMMQQQAQNFQQQVGNWMQQQAQQGMQAMQQQAQAQFQGMQEGAQQMLQQALGGPAQVQALIDEASAKGDMKGAVGLIRQRLQAQLKVSLSNLHNLASDPLAGGGFGSANGGVSNDAYFMSLNIPLVRLIKFLQAQLAHLPKMASGGIVTKPTTALIGEAGPEAIVPLSQINQFISSIFQKFTGGRTALTNTTGGAFNSYGALSNFGNAFQGAARYLSVMMDRGAPGAAQAMQQWMDAQQRASDALGYMHRYRHINLSPGHHGYQMQPASLGGGAVLHGGGSGVTIHANFHGTNFDNPSHVRQAANRLYDELSNVARSRGTDMSGKDPFRSPLNVGRVLVNAPTAIGR